MTNAELLAKIKAEIERRWKDYRNSVTPDQPKYRTHYFVGKGEVCEELLSFLSTLESEKPMDLEEEINRYLREECSDDDEPGIHEIAEHFANWGYLRAAEKYNEIENNRQRAEESVPNDLEEAAKKHSCYDEDCEGVWYEPIVRNAFIAGAKWQKEQYHFFNEAWAENMQAELDRNYENGKQAMKEQMMEEAVDGEYDFYPSAVYLDVPIPRMNHGDKVRVIILKNES